MKLHSLSSAIAAAALLVMSPLPAQASVVVVSTQADFQSKVGSRGTDTFDDLAADTVVNPSVFTSTGNYFTRTAGSLGYRLNVGTWYTLYNNTDDNNPADVRLSPENAARALVFDTFNAPIFGIGANFFITDVWGDDATGKAIKITLTDINNAVTNLTVGNTTASTYRGFVSTVAIKSLSVIADKPIEDNWATVNNLTLAGAKPLPEPGTLLLSALSLAVLLACRSPRGLSTPRRRAAAMRR